jgi:hypothetical protein
MLQFTGFIINLLPADAQMSVQEYLPQAVLTPP